MYISDWSQIEFKLEVQLKKTKIDDDKADELWEKTYPYLEKARKELGELDWAEANTPRKHPKWFRGTYSILHSCAY